MVVKHNRRNPRSWDHGKQAVESQPYSGDESSRLESQGSPFHSGIRLLEAERKGCDVTGVDDTSFGFQ